MKKYLPHIRIPFKLFDDERIKKIPEEHRSSSLLILIALLKFVNSQNGQCYPRQATISSMVCLSRSTIYRCTDLLVEVGIIKKKRLKSTLLYVINPDYIVNKKIDVSSRDYDVSGKHIPRFMMTDISKSIIKEPTYISNIIKEVIDKGGDRSKVISTLATLPADTLNKAIKEKDNPYFCSLAIQEQSNKRGKLVDIPRNIVDNVRKKTHFGYQSKVSKTKRDYDRTIKSKDLLRGDSKD
nr:putative transcriptional regulator [uncultured Mediterranean phage uvMED]